MKKQIRLFEAFAGIGSQLKALKNIENECNLEVISLGACDFYIDAIVAYMSIHYGNLKPETHYSKDEIIKLLSKYTFSADSKSIVSDNYFNKMNENKLRMLFPYLYAYVNNDYFLMRYPRTRERERERGTDITKYNVLPKNIDILTYSFPCQDLSQQGKQKGITKSSRSGLLYQIERILLNDLSHLPKVLLLENVKALTTKKFINDFKKWIDVLNKLGYESKWKVLNSADFGSAQNRERVFMVSIRKDIKIQGFEFPNKIKNLKKLSSIIKLKNSTQNLNLLATYKLANFSTSKSNITKSYLINYTKFNSEAYVYSTLNLGPTLTASGANSRIKFYFEKSEIIRYITDFEAYQYMGFTKIDYSKVRNSNLLSSSKIIYTASNSISVEVLQAIFKEVIKCI